MARDLLERSSALRPARLVACRHRQSRVDCAAQLRRGPRSSISKPIRRDRHTLSAAGRRLDMPIGEHERDFVVWQLAYTSASLQKPIEDRVPMAVAPFGGTPRHSAGPRYERKKVGVTAPTQNGWKAIALSVGARQELYISTAWSKEQVEETFRRAGVEWDWIPAGQYATRRGTYPIRRTTRANSGSSLAFVQYLERDFVLN